LLKDVEKTDSVLRDQPARAEQPTALPGLKMSRRQKPAAHQVFRYERIDVDLGAKARVSPIRVMESERGGVEQPSLFGLVFEPLAARRLNPLTEGAYP
jgi:hypothetical protein